jgi:5'-methylthioadenosine phosphorylase
MSSTDKDRRPRCGGAETTNDRARPRRQKRLGLFAFRAAGGSTPAHDRTRGFVGARRSVDRAAAPVDNAARKQEACVVKTVVGVIGGSGLYHLDGLRDGHEESVSTPWGDPSDTLRMGRIGETEAVFLARHGRGHRFPPSSINYRANIDALKRAGVTDIVAVSACGSFRRELFPGMFVFIDQIEDRTYLRRSSFFGTGCVAHVSMAHPIAPLLRKRLVSAAAAEEIPHRDGGTYVCIEGPQFSSLAESLGYQARGADVIGMTCATEAKLAREAEISYAVVAMVTDYDCWHEEHGAVDVAAVVKVMEANASRANALVARALGEFPKEHEACPVGSDRALDHAIMTQASARDPELLRKLDAVAGRVLS